MQGRTPQGRRAFLGSAAVASAALSGCLGILDDSGGTALSDHAAAKDLDDEPMLGNADASRTMIVYDGPACTECHTYAKETYPQVKSDLIEPGKVAYYGRLAPEYEWGKMASNVLEAMTARDPATYWPGLDFYTLNQDQFDTDNVFAKSKTFIQENTDLDAAAVIEDARAEKYWDEVQEDKQSWKDAGGNSRPMFFVFRDGEFVGEIAGPQGYSTIENTLGL